MGDERKYGVKRGWSRCLLSTPTGHAAGSDLDKADATSICFSRRDGDSMCLMRLVSKYISSMELKGRIARLSLA